MDRCYRRFDTSYKSTGYRPPSANIAGFGCGSSVNMMAQGLVRGDWVGQIHFLVITWVCHLCLVMVHRRSLQLLTQWGDNPWYPDSGATHHLTNSTTNLWVMVTLFRLFKLVNPLLSLILGL